MSAFIGAALLLSGGVFIAWIAFAMWMASEKAYSDRALWFRWVAHDCGVVDENLTDSEIERAKVMDAIYERIIEEKRQRAARTFTVRVRL